jgi:hypothetical protein
MNSEAINQVAAMTENVLREIKRSFYEGRDVSFYKHRTALIRGIMRYGLEMHRRGWEVSPEYIEKEVLDVLMDFRRRSIPQDYFPNYFSKSLMKNLGQRAEDHKSVKSVVGRRLAKVQVVDGVVQPTMSDVMAAVLMAMPKKKTHKPQTKQQSLL